MNKSTPSRRDKQASQQPRLKPRKDPGYVLRDADDDDVITTDARGRTWAPVKDTALPVDIVLPRLDGVRRTSTGWRAHCPSHSDSRPSLDISVTDGHVLLLCCRSGIHCDAASIMDALGLSERYLFPTMPAQLAAKSNGTQPGTVATVHRDANASIPPIDPAFAKLVKSYLTHPDAAERREELAQTLGVSASALTAMDIGWTGSAWSIPEHDHQRRVVGIAYRTANGRKWFEGGGRRGLIIPNDVGDDGPIHIPEGASDTAALMSVGEHAIGRPMAKTPALVARWLREYLSGPVGTRPIVVVGDRDTAGIDGAERLASTLCWHLGRPIVWSIPPEPYGDLREMINAGAWSRGLRPRIIWSAKPVHNIAK